MEPASSAIASTAEYADSRQWLSGSLSHYVLEDNRTGDDAPVMDSSAYLKGMVAGIQTIAVLVIIGQAGVAGPGRIRFAVENSGLSAEEFEEAVSISSGIPRQEDGPPVVKGIRIESMTY